MKAQQEGAKRDTLFDCNEFMKFLLESNVEREKIGPAWFLFFDIARNADRAGIYADTYAKLAKKYGVAVITVKTWRQHLRKHSIIESYSKGHSVAFRLLEPYLSFLRPVKPIVTDHDDLQGLKALSKLISRTIGEETKVAA